MSKRTAGLIRFMLIFTVMFVMLGFPGRAYAAATAKIGSMNYSSFDKALSAVKNGQTIKLVRNASHNTDGSLYRPNLKGIRITIDLNKKKLTLNKQFDTAAKAQVTFKNGTVAFSSSQQGRFYFYGKSNIHFIDCKITDSLLSVKEGSTLKFTRCTLTGKSVTLGVDNKSSLIINGGTYTCNGAMILFGLNGGKCTINSGTFDSMKEKFSASCLFSIHPLGSSVNSTMTINGGTFKAKDSAIYLGKDQTLIINKGSLSSKNDSTITAYGKLKVKRATIHGGKPASQWAVAHGIIAGDSAVIQLYSGSTVRSDSGTAIGYFYNANPKVYVYGGRQINGTR